MTLQEKLKSVETSAYIIAKGKHDELEAKEAMDAKRRRYQNRCIELSQENKVFVGQLRALEAERDRLRDDNMAVRAFLRMLRRENSRLRFVSVVDGRLSDTGAPVVVSDEWSLGIEQLLEDCVCRLFGETTKKKSRKSEDKVSVITRCTLHMYAFLTWFLM
jgi:hypothetical protein